MLRILTSVQSQNQIILHLYFLIEFLCVYNLKTRAHVIFPCVQVLPSLGFTRMQNQLKTTTSYPFIVLSSRSAGSDVRCLLSILGGHWRDVHLFPLVSYRLLLFSAMTSWVSLVVSVLLLANF